MGAHVRACVCTSGHTPNTSRYWVCTRLQETAVLFQTLAQCCNLLTSVRCHRQTGLYLNEEQCRTYFSNTIKTLDAWAASSVTVKVRETFEFSSPGFKTTCVSYCRSPSHPKELCTQRLWLTEIMLSKLYSTRCIILRLCNNFCWGQQCLFLNEHEAL